MKKILLFLGITGIFINYATSQFAPPAGQAGSTAIFKDSSIIKEWAIHCIVQRGYINITMPSAGMVTSGNPEDAIGPIGQNGVVSLGDGGTAIVTFQNPIANGTGADFAIFENAFNDAFLELAFVEVSSDGVYFARFPSVSLTQNQTQIDGFGTIDATKIHNLAGKYRSNYGTPFDLDDINDSLVNKNHITHIKITDVVGCIQTPYATYDSQGNVINDPFPTEFPTGGFDLDAVGVIHSLLDIKEDTFVYCSVFPNPATEKIFIHATNINASMEITMYDSHGIKSFQQIITPSKPIDISALADGIWIIQIKIDKQIIHKKIIKKSC